MFRERLVELRKKRNLSQKDLAEVIGIDRTTIGHWEIGRREPSRQVLEVLSGYFGVSIDYLLGLSNYEQDPKQQFKEDLLTEDVEELIKKYPSLKYRGKELTEKQKKTIINMLKVMLDEE